MNERLPPKSKKNYHEIAESQTLVKKKKRKKNLIKNESMRDRFDKLIVFNEQLF